MLTSSILQEIPDLTQVCAWNERHVLELMGFLSEKDEYLPEFARMASGELLEQFLHDRERGWSLQGPAPDNSEQGSGDYSRRNETGNSGCPEARTS